MTNGHVGWHFDGGYGVCQRNLEERMLLEFCLEKELCESNTWFRREERWKVTFRIGENETRMDFVSIKNIDGLCEM